jgi:hypothetical protein
MIIQYISIALEAAIVLISLLAATIKKKTYCYGFAFTFFIYVFYDTIKLRQINISNIILSFSFFIATLSALWSVWMIYTGEK